MKSPWTVSTESFVNEPESIMRNGNVYQLANGYMGYRGTLDEFGPRQKVGITLAGIFDQVGNAWREPVNAPNGGFTIAAVGGKSLTALGKTLRHHSARLHLDGALYERESIFEVKGNAVRISSVRFLSAASPHLGVIKFSVCCDRSTHVTIRTGIDYNIWDLNGPHLVNLKPEVRDSVLAVQGITHEMRKRVAVAEAVDQAPGKEAREVKDRRHLRVLRFEADAGTTYTFHKYFAVFTENDPRTGEVIDSAVATVQKAKALGYEACLANHRLEWQKKWERCDVELEGDDEAQRALRYSIFQLLMVAPTKGSTNSIAARALSGQVYKGAIFWDTEMFMFPFFLHTYPEKAVELLRYRIKTLDGARRKATTEGPGYRGAFYAWESQETGDDACSYFNVGDPSTGRDLRTHFRDKQVHISGDVAIAMWDYFKITGDDRILREGGAEVILECARFYVSYAYFKKDKGRYEILDVIGPDEYHERVNNNAFTNMVVRETFGIANAVVDHLKRHHPDELSRLIKKIGIESELATFVEGWEQLFLPEPDSRTGVIEQFDGYNRLRDATVAELNAKKLHPNEYLGAGQGLAVETKVIKQADVVMMLNLFKARFSTEVKRANWEYYEPFTEHGSSLSACAYAMVATEFGNLDFAYQYFLRTAKIDLEAKYKMHVGNVFTGGSHPAANGGAWMTAVFGFAGLHADEARVAINPRLFGKWRGIRFKLAYKGDMFEIRITKSVVAITPSQDNRHARLFVVGGVSVDCAPGTPQTIKYDVRRPPQGTAPHRISASQKRAGVAEDAPARK
jgi:kojibiose phosphorylase